MYARKEPQFAFGYGLSYTTFKLSNLRCADTLAPDGTLEVGVDVANTGGRTGDEVVQLYVRFPQSKVERAPKALKGFQRLTVEAGKVATATIKVRAADLAYWDAAAHGWVVEPGPVELLVGNSSRDVDLTLRKTITVQP
jgi:beta-glucosidase